MVPVVHGGSSAVQMQRIPLMDPLWETLPSWFNFRNQTLEWTFKHFDSLRWPEQPSLLCTLANKITSHGSDRQAGKVGALTVWLVWCIDKHETRWFKKKRFLPALVTVGCASIGRPCSELATGPRWVSPVTLSQLGLAPELLRPWVKDVLRVKKAALTFQRFGFQWNAPPVQLQWCIKGIEKPRPCTRFGSANCPADDVVPLWSLRVCNSW